MHSPSRVQIPPSPLPAPGFHWNPGASCVPMPPARVRAPGSVRVCGVKGLKDTTCWFCSDFSAFWCGKINIEVGGSQLEGWTKRVGCVATCRLAGTEKSVLKAVGSSRGVNAPTCLMRGLMRGQVRTLGVSWAVRRGVLATCVPRRAPGPAHAHVGPLIRAWARSCARGPAHAHVGSPAQTWNSGLTCDIAGERTL